MLFPSRHIPVDSIDGIATLCLAFPGAPVNTLTPNRLLELEAAIQTVITARDVDILVIRSGLPGGFCGGDDPEILARLSDDSAATRYAQIGQRVLGCLADADIISLAFIEGPCLGPGLELALACDYRIAVAEPQSSFGYPRWRHQLPPCWGGHARLHPRVRDSLRVKPVLEPRAALQCGLIDDLFSRRRAKIELRARLDSLQARPRKRATSTERLAEALAHERIAFRRALTTPDVRSALDEELLQRSRLQGLGEPFNPIPRFPERVAFLGEDLTGLASAILLRGSSVAIVSQSTHAHDSIRSMLHEAVHQGRANPIERDAALARLTVNADRHAIQQAGLVIVGQNPTHAVEWLVDLPARAVVAVPVGLHQRLPGDPARIIGYAITDTGICLTPGSDTCVDIVHTVAHWFASLGLSVCLNDAEERMMHQHSDSRQFAAA
jgi:enoyl-CoA hydratase/carnithine racemase